MKKTIIKKVLIRILILVIFLFSTIPGQSQQSLLTLEDIYVNHSYSPKRFGPVKWYKNGDGYTSLEQSADKQGANIVLYQTKSGYREILVPASLLIPQGKEKALRISNYQFSEDGNYMMVFTNTKRVWRYHTRGD